MDFRDKEKIKKKLKFKNLKEDGIDNIKLLKIKSERELQHPNTDKIIKR